MTNTINKRKFSQGWLIAIACMLIQAIPFGVASNIHPQFLGYIIEKEGFALGAISAMFTIGTIISALFSPSIGKLYNKFSAKLIFTVGAILSAGGVFMLGIAGSSLSLFYLGYGISQVGTAAISSIGIPVLITSWFDDSIKGKVLGVVFSASGLGNIFLQQLTASWIAADGYQLAYKKFALLSIAVGVVVSILFIRMPKNKSEMISGKKDSKEENKEVSVKKIQDIHLQKLKV